MVSDLCVGRVRPGGTWNLFCAEGEKDGKERKKERERVHFGIFLRVHYGGDGDAEVGDWAPEICGNCQFVRLVMFRSGMGLGGFDVRVEQT